MRIITDVPTQMMKSVRSTAMFTKLAVQLRYVQQFTQVIRLNSPQAANEGVFSPKMTPLLYIQNATKKIALADSKSVVATTAILQSLAQQVVRF
jgi:hypothetical protein